MENIFGYVSYAYLVVFYFILFFTTEITYILSLSVWMPLAGVTVVHTDKNAKSKTWLCVHLPIVWMRLGSATPKAELLFVTLLNSSCCLRREAWVSEVTACFPNRKWNIGQKARQKKMFCFHLKKEKGIHTYTCSTCIFTLFYLP